MPKFSRRSTRILKTCHRDLQVIFTVAIKFFDFTVLEGFRGKERQDRFFKNKKSKVRWPRSKHNKKPSMAVDAAPYPIEWENKDRMKFFIGYILGIARMLKYMGTIDYDLFSGIDWDGDTILKDHNFHDHPHFELKQKGKK